MVRRLLRAGLVLTMTLGVVAAVPGTGNASRPVDGGHYEFGPDVFLDQEICGVSATLTVSGSGHFATRTVPGSEGTAFFAFDNSRVTEVWSTGPGQTFTIERRSTFRETEAVDVGPVTYDPDGDGPLGPITSDDVWLFTSQDSGTFRAYGSDGKVLLRGNGVARAQEQFDTLGDQVPGGQYVPDTFVPLKEVGQIVHDERFCDAVLGELT